MANHALSYHFSVGCSGTCYSEEHVNSETQLLIFQSIVTPSERKIEDAAYGQESYFGCR